MKIYLFAFTAILATVFSSGLNQANAQTDVVAAWEFLDYDFEDTVAAQDAADLPGRFTLNAEVNNTVSNAAVEIFLGNAGNLDDNGGGGFTNYTSPVSGQTFLPTRTVKFDDLAGGGNDFDIGGTSTFSIDTNDGMGAVAGEDFGNDALLYFTLDGSGFQDFQLRFDAEGTPVNPDPDDPNVPEPFLPDGFDIFYRTTPGGTWFREVDQNNVPLIAQGDPDAENENQRLGIDANEDGIVDSYVSLAAALNNASSIEIHHQRLRQRRR